MSANCLKKLKLKLYLSQYLWVLVGDLKNVFLTFNLNHVEFSVKILVTKLRPYDLREDRVLFENDKRYSEIMTI